MTQPTAPGTGRPIGRRQGAWGLWWLCGITFGVYYLVWYHRTNRELATFAGTPRDATCQWWSQIIPIYGLIAFFHQIDRVNAAHAAIGSPVRISKGMGVLSCIWFSSNVRYIQRRINSLWDTAVTTGYRLPTEAYEAPVEAEPAPPAAEV